MNVITTPIEGLLILEPKVLKDDRGYFFESYNMRTLQQAISGYDTAFVQDNQARSVKNVLRGLHYQNHPTPQAKLGRGRAGGRERRDAVGPASPGFGGAGRATHLSASTSESASICTSTRRPLRPGPGKSTKSWQAAASRPG